MVTTQTAELLSAAPRKLHSGLWVPEAEESTAPIDIVDRSFSQPPQERVRASFPAEQPVAQLAAAPAPDTAPPPTATTPATKAVAKSPAGDDSKGTKPAKHRVEPQREEAGPSGWQRLGHALADRVELANARRRDEVRAAKERANGEAESGDITILALVIVSLVTLAVSGLAFALSFDIMLEAAKKYGWEPGMAKLFPILIDAGAVGGTFMGAISANKTYVHVGRSVLTLTLAASILFNLVGHQIKGSALLGVPLPAEWAWTGTVAAVFIPVVLAYFIHAFSKALKAYVDQVRHKKAIAAARAEADAEAQREAARKAELARIEARVKADAEAKKEADRVARANQPAPDPAPAKPTLPTPRGPSRKTGTEEPRKATIDDALRIGLARGINKPSPLKQALTDEGFALPASPTTVENWCKRLKTEADEVATAGRAAT
jgi:hypothetical protein